MAKDASAGQQPAHHCIVRGRVLVTTKDGVQMGAIRAGGAQEVLRGALAENKGPLWMDGELPVTGQQ